MRTLVDIPEEDIAWLDRRAAEQGKSRTAIVREAVANYRAEIGSDWIARGAGYWKDRTDIGDSIDYQRAMREDRSPD
ncbi:MAG: CopG family transcriptional regulator [Sphingomonas sp. 28-62-20]|uniref:ribbon-helix-helix domain-containing protein n=1 Tax=Sphingomonas sp. 28-62-20 TaxID=1970433 RepID=UPI000BCECBD3|nr:MAG: CopG family transcriptional regulator [Sphingomonas sp. 28-62-20]